MSPCRAITNYTAALCEAAMTRDVVCPWYFHKQESGEDFAWMHIGNTGLILHYWLSFLLPFFGFFAVGWYFFFRQFDAVPAWWNTLLLPKHYGRPDIEERCAWLHMESLLYVGFAWWVSYHVARRLLR